LISDKTAQHKKLIYELKQTGQSWADVARCLNNMESCGTWTPKKTYALYVEYTCDQKEQEA
jgi:hypothetical protein